MILCFHMFFFTCHSDHFLYRICPWLSYNAMSFLFCSFFFRGIATAQDMSGKYLEINRGQHGNNKTELYTYIYVSYVYTYTYHSIYIYIYTYCGDVRRNATFLCRCLWKMSLVDHMFWIFVFEEGEQILSFRKF